MADEKTERTFPRRRVRLLELRPMWLHTDERELLATGSRFQMGVSILCPGHPWADHRLTLWFLNPLDGGTPLRGVPLYFVSGSDFESLTLTSGLVVVPPQKQPMAEFIWVDGHWAGYIFDGYVIDALRLG